MIAAATAITVPWMFCECFTATDSITWRWFPHIVFCNLVSLLTEHVRSEGHVTVPVQVKFINRTKRHAQVEWVTPHGHKEKKRVLPPGRCWRTDTWEGHCWVCCDARTDSHALRLNYGRFYWARKSVGYKERVVITEGQTICCSTAVLLHPYYIRCHGHESSFQNSHCCKDHEECHSNDSAHTVQVLLWLCSFTI